MRITDIQTPEDFTRFYAESEYKFDLHMEDDINGTYDLHVQKKHGELILCRRNHRQDWKGHLGLDRNGNIRYGVQRLAQLTYWDGDYSIRKYNSQRINCDDLDEMLDFVAGRFNRKQDQS